MLRQETLPQQAVIPAQTPVAEIVADAADVRVTPAEFAQAVAALETKRAQEAARSGETIRVGEALTQLSLDATPAEVLAQVLTARNANAALAEQRRTRRTTLLTLAAIVLVSFVLVAFPIISGLREAKQRKENRTEKSPVVLRLNESVPVKDGDTVCLLSEIPENHPVRVEARQIAKLLLIAPPNISAPFDEDSSPWILVKQQGSLYLLGWLENPMSDAVLRQGPVRVFRRPIDELDTNLWPSGNSFLPQPILLRADTINATAFTPSEIITTGFVPEPQALEKARAVLMKLSK